MFFAWLHAPFISAIALFQQAERAIRSDTLQPGRKRGVELEPLKSAIRPQESFLHNFFSIRFVSGYPVSDSEHMATVALDQDAKRVTVAAQDLLHCSFITGHHRTIRPPIP